ncbi:hypothetical protein HOD20_07530 [archaeon]|jgi:predicted SAM-dependent methyltransferase|nr:hypothetical protein [archaeon]MBT4647047.1 hypothetical protein [archaeon]MBT6820956.1 hypothetical protein [archaeon]MBT7392148.1 hypothetical protein [archaeon]
MKKLIKKLKTYPNKILKKKGYKIIHSKFFSNNDYVKLFGKDATKNRRFYNIGAGNFKHPFWTNIDHYSKWYKENSFDMDYDLTSNKPINIDSNSASIIYSSHTIEHITTENALFLFKEAFRILKKGQFIRISTPDIDLAYWAYKNKDMSFFKKNGKLYLNKSLEQLFLYSFASQLSTIYNKKGINDDKIKKIFSNKNYIDSLNKLIEKCDIQIQRKNPGHHINWWNEEKLIKMLKEAGFSETYRSGYGQSRCPALRDTNYFDVSNTNLSLYIEAIK